MQVNSHHPIGVLGRICVLVLFIRTGSPVIFLPLFLKERNLLTNRNNDHQCLGLTCFVLLAFPQKLLQTKSVPPKTRNRQKTKNGPNFDLIWLIKTNARAQVGFCDDFVTKLARLWKTMGEAHLGERGCHLVQVTWPKWKKWRSLQKKRVNKVCACHTGSVSWQFCRIGAMFSDADRMKYQVLIPDDLFTQKSHKSVSFWSERRKW